MRIRDIKLANEYAKLVIARKHKRNITNKEYQELATKVYPTVTNLTYLRAKRTLNNAEVKNLAENRIMQLLDEYGLTEKKSSELIDESIKLAKKQENAKLLLEQAKYLNELRGLAPNKTVITESRSYNSDLTGISDVISKEKETKRKLTVSTTVSNNGDNEEKTQ